MTTAATTTPPAPMQRSLGSLVGATLTAGAIAGALDIVSAMATWAPKGATPDRILQSVAAGVQGKAAFQGGAGSAALGLALHMGIATVAAGVFVAAATRIPFLTRRPLIAGPAFGVAMWLAMNYVVVPLSAAPSKGPGPADMIVIGLLVHMIMFGLPVSLVTRRFLGAR